jgi:hypothetical protein
MRIVIQLDGGPLKDRLDAIHKQVLSHFKSAITNKDSGAATYSVWLAMILVWGELEPRLIYGPEPASMTLRRLCDRLIKRMTSLPLALSYAKEFENPTLWLFPELDPDYVPSKTDSTV